MSLPPWEPRTEAEVDAFKEFVLDELDRLNVASYSDPEVERGVEMLTSMLREGALRRELEELGAHVPPPKRKRGGQRKHAGKEGMSLRLAIRDVERCATAPRSIGLKPK